VDPIGGGDVVADADLVSAFGTACAGSEFVTLSSGGWGTDPSSLIDLLSPVLSEMWRSAGGCVVGPSTTVELIGGRDVVADGDLVLAFGAACNGSEFVTLSSGGRGTDPSSLISLLSHVLSEVWRSAGGCVAGPSMTVELTRGGDVVADADPVSAFGVACAGSEFVTPSSSRLRIDPSSLIGLPSAVISGTERVCLAGRFRIMNSPILAANTPPEAAKLVRMPRRKPRASIWRSRCTRS